MKIRTAITFHFIFIALQRISKIGLFACLLTFGLNTHAQNPPGTVPFGGNLYWDVTEISNQQYREYEFWVKKQFGIGSPEHKAVLPDTTVWRSKNHYNEPFVEFYYRHPAYASYPVVGVSYDQVVAFCQWRSDRVNEKHYRDKNKLDEAIAIDFDKIPNIYKFRLPTQNEWEKIAAAGYSPKTLKKMSKKKYANKPHENFIRNAPIEPLKNSVLSDNAGITTNVLSYFPNSVGVFNIMGNVAEMTATKGIAKGGSWLHTKEESTIEKIFTYEKPTKWLGFRCVCEIKQ